jgi:hypothetical protein
VQANIPMICAAGYFTFGKNTDICMPLAQFNIPDFYYGKKNG